MREMSRPTNSHPASVNVRLTLEQRAAIASIAEENDVNVSEATRMLIEMGYADLKRRMGEALRDHAAEPAELAESPERARQAGVLGNAVRFSTSPEGEPQW